jgi:hypothetical protein
MDLILTNIRIYHTIMGLGTLAYLNLGGISTENILKGLDEDKLKTLKLAIEYKAWSAMGVNPLIMMFGRENPI